MNEIFDLVYRGLKWLSKISGLTYEEINIIIWYFILPASFVFLLERFFKTKYLTSGFAAIVFLVILGVKDFELFSKALFQKSVDFLNWFDNLGINYVQASVLICVILPILMIAALVFLKKQNP